MKRIFSLIPILLLCSSCASNNLFFTENPASIEDVNTFVSEISDSAQLIPSGWYKYKKYNHRKELIFSCTFKGTYISKKGYRMSNLNGIYRKNDMTTKIYSDENFTIVEQKKSNSPVKRYGGENVTFSFGYELFSFDFITYSNEIYLRDNSICCIKNSSDVLPSMKYAFGAVYNNELSKLLKAELEDYSYRDYNLNLYTYSHTYLESCSETYSKLDKTYDESIDNETLNESDLMLSL